MKKITFAMVSDWIFAAAVSFLVAFVIINYFVPRPFSFVYAGLAAAADVDIDTTSGAVRLTVPTAIGATFRYKTVSGSLHCDDYRVKGGTSVFGEGGCTAAVSTVSGSLTVTDR